MRESHHFLDLVKKVIPAKVRQFIRARVSLKDFDIARRVAANPHKDHLAEDYPDSEFCLGILEEVMQYHKHYIAACRELKISYRVLSILDDNWVESFRSSGCDAFLVWPSVTPTNAKTAFDYRLFILEKEMREIVFPSWKECWLTENKPRLRDWLQANHIKHPKTAVFFNEKQALEFAGNTTYPVVVKTATGASGSGVFIVDKQQQLEKLVRQSFAKGLRPKSFDLNDRQWGSVFIQQFYPDVHEWRMIRIGDSYFGYRKERGESGMHSASKKWSWLDPGVELLDLVKKVSDCGKFDSMDVDVFKTKDGQLMVNECQTVFGCSTPEMQMKVNDVPGRYLHENGSWRFEGGEFCQNHMCNLRIQDLVTKLRAKRGEGPSL